MREISDKIFLKSFCEKFCKIVEQHCKYIIVSGYLVIALGRSRGTQDIDMIIEKLDLKKFKNLHKDLVKNGFHCVQDEDSEEIYTSYLKENTSVRYIYEKELLPEMEIKFAKDILDHIQIESRIKIPLTGVDVWFGSIEANIAFKEDYLKSEKDLEDAKHLRLMFQNEINQKEINRWKTLIKKVKMK